MTKKATTTKKRKNNSTQKTPTKKNQTSKKKKNIVEKTKKFTGKLNKETLKKYKEKFNSDDDFNQLVDKLLEEHFKNIA